MAGLEFAIPAPATQPTTASKRLRLLDESERAALYDRPQFTDEERAGYFSLIPEDRALMETFSEPAIQAFFVLTLGYFKAKQRFFAVTLEAVHADLTFIVAHLGLVVAPGELRVPHPRTIRQQRTLILEVTNYRHCFAQHRQAAFEVVRQAARISPKPQYLVRVALQYFATERIILPGYSYLQEEIVGRAITAEERRLLDALTTHLTDADRAALETLFEERDGWYYLTRLQRAPKDFGPRELRRERDRGTELVPFYDLAGRLLAQLDLSPEAIQYYASLVGVYTAPRLNDLESWMVYIYLLCFLQHRYHRLHDHLLSGFMHAVKDFRDEAKAAADAQVAAYRLERTQDLIRAGRVLQLFTNDQIAPTAPFSDAQAAAFAILERDRLERAANHIATGADCDEGAFFWQHVDTMARRFKPRLRPLILGLDLRAMRSSSPLLEALQFLHETFRHDRALSQIDAQTIPTRCIPIRLKRYLYQRNPPQALSVSAYGNWLPAPGRSL